LIGQYAHGNEPSHHIAYLYDFVGEPWKTQKYIRQIMDAFYKPTPDGLIGNEDCGQMSAWYVLSASGFYQVTPGLPEYALGTPLFKQIIYHLGNKKDFIIQAPNVSSRNIYIRYATLNGKPLERTYFDDSELFKGGVLELDMTDRPAYYSMFESANTGNYDNFPAVPLIEGSRTFSGTTEVKLSAPADYVIYFTDDGSAPSASSKRYITPITIKDTTKLSAITVNSKGLSPIAEAVFYKQPNSWTVKIDSKYSPQYTGGGDEGLIDGIRGTTNFASGEWQGYQGQDFVATVDLQKVTQILMLGGGFLQNARSWIWMPTHIEFELSQDGVNFSKVADIKTDVAQNDLEPKIRDYMVPIKPVDARYVRIHAYNFGKIPSWHPGAGGEPWIFVDEILIR
jgi:Glycosyl hydrolase family 92/Chitobiase/beta-hexosaminidase C-terminal domain/F5/8 type C domain